MCLFSGADPDRKLLGHVCKLVGRVGTFVQTVVFLVGFPISVLQSGRLHAGDYTNWTYPLA